MIIISEKIVLHYFSLYLSPFFSLWNHFFFTIISLFNYILASTVPGCRPTLNIKLHWMCIYIYFAALNSKNICFFRHFLLDYIPPFPTSPVFRKPMVPKGATSRRKTWRQLIVLIFKFILGGGCGVVVGWFPNILDLKGLHTSTFQGVLNGW